MTEISEANKTLVTTTMPALLTARQSFLNKRPENIKIFLVNVLMGMKSNGD
jgi:hypothetical protein